MDAEALLRQFAAPVDARLEELLASGEPERLLDAMRHSVLAPGKRLRPALCMASAQAAGGVREQGLDAGCAVELVHCFSLIHDDLPALDDDDLRRGRPTCHIVFGEAMAILAGDALFAMAFELLAGAAADPKRSLRAVRALAEASGTRGLVGGEVADLLAEGREASLAEVRGIHQRKTGALIRAACQIGAIVAGADDAAEAALTRFGERAGLAFQISDDLLNELSTSAALGKAAGSDRERRKATYPAAHGIEGARQAAREETEAALAALEPLGDRADDLRIFARYIVARLR
jgi:geranylgeranyl diphosphate synthase, type II